MTLNDLMKLANLGYPDGFLDQYWDFEKAVPIPNGQGDTLAKFVVIELVETYDPNAPDHEQRSVASDAMLKAISELTAVSSSLELGQLAGQPAS